MESKDKIIWRVGRNDNSMTWLGFRPGRCYQFTRAEAWRSGDVVAVETPRGRYICYLHACPCGRVILAWADSSYRPLVLSAEQITVHGVCRFETDRRRDVDDLDWPEVIAA